MTDRMRLIRRLLAVGHFGWAAVLLSAAALITISMLRTVPHISTGTVWRNLGMALMFAAGTTLPMGALGAWMVILGRQLWSGQVGGRRALLATHGFLLVIGSFAVIVGIQGMHAAERSAAQGGGLLGPVAVIPLLFGVPMVVLALGSIAVALAAMPQDQSEPR